MSLHDDTTNQIQQDYRTLTTMVGRWNDLNLTKLHDESVAWALAQGVKPRTAEAIAERTVYSVRGCLRHGVELLNWVSTADMNLTEVPARTGPQG